jgi:hypothetical protein
MKKLLLLTLVAASLTSCNTTTHVLLGRKGQPSRQSRSKSISSRQKNLSRSLSSMQIA